MSAPLGVKVKSDHRWGVLVVLCAAALIINVDNTILNVALPTLVRDLHATSSQLQWIVDSYSMVFAGLLLVSGSLADRFGRQKFFLLGLAVFGTGSIAAAFSGSVHLLIPSRVLMGLGAALTIPSSLSIVNDVFRDPRQRAKAIGAWGGIIGLGIAIGPIAGGLLLAHFWWGSVFLVNVPIVVAALIGTLVLVPDSKNPAVERPDPVGVVLSVAGLGLLLWAIIEGPTQGWASPDVIGAGVASLIVIGAFIAWESHSRHPMLKLGLFADRRFSTAAAAECLGLFGLAGALFVVTQFLQFDLGFSPLQAGLRILPMAGVLVPVRSRVPGGGAHHRDQIDGRRRSRRRGGWPVAGLSGLDGCHQLRGRGARPAVDRPRRRAVVAHGDQLGGGVGPPGRLGGRVGRQHHGPPGRRGDRRRRGRQRAGDSLPGPHGQGARRAAPARLTSRTRSSARSAVPWPSPAA